jgi:hypothetical protein
VVDRSITSIFWGLLKAFVGNHLVLYGSQKVFKSCSFLPVLDKVEVLDTAVVLVDTGQVAFIIELKNGCSVGVIGTALNEQAVNSVFEVGLHRLKCTL